MSTRKKVKRLNSLFRLYLSGRIDLQTYEFVTGFILSSPAMNHQIIVAAAVGRGYAPWQKNRAYTWLCPHRRERFERLRIPF